MRRYLFLLPLLLLVLSGVAEAQSVCTSMIGAAWTRCYDFRISDHGFTPLISNGTRGMWPAGQHVPGTGFVALPHPLHPNNGSGWRKTVRISQPSDWSGTSITQAKVIYQLTPGIADVTSGWLTISGSPLAIEWSRDELVSGSGTVSSSADTTFVSFGQVWAQASVCNSGCTSGTIDGSMTLIAIVLGGDGEPSPGGDDPSSGGGTPGIDVGVTPIFDSISTYMPMFFLMFAVPAAILIAAVIVFIIIYAIVTAIKSVSGR